MITALTSPIGSLVLLFAFLLIGAAFNYFGGNPKILYLPLMGICLLIFFIGHSYIQSESARIESAKKESHRAPVSHAPEPVPAKSEDEKETHPKEHNNSKPSPQLRRMSPPAPVVEGSLRIMTDGQSDALRNKLRGHAGSSVSLVLVGGDPQLGTEYGQLVKIFNEAGWTVQQTRIGMAVVMGAAFPNGPYMTASNIASPLVNDVFAAFASIGINVPLAPNAFTASSGSRAPEPDVIIVVH